MSSSAVPVTPPPELDYKLGGKAEISAPAIPGAMQFALAPGGPHRVLDLPLQAPSFDVAYAGHYAFIAAGADGLLVFDLAADAQQRMVAQIKGRGRITRAVLSGGYIYLADSAGALQVVDVGDPQQPQKVFSYPLLYPLDALGVVGERAYIANGRRLEVVDVSNPRALRMLGAFPLVQPVSAMRVAEGRAYLVERGAGLRMLDVSDPEFVMEAGYYPGDVRDVALAHGRAYLAGGSGLTVLDVSEPQAPRWLGSVNHIGAVLALSGEGEQLVLANERNELMLVDARNPQLPRVTATYRMKQPPGAFIFSEFRVLAGSAAGLELIDFSAPVPGVSSLGANFGGSRRAVLRDNLLYVADWFSGLHIYDVANPSQPRHLSNYHTQGSSKGVLVRGDHAFVADDDHGVQILDVSDPRSPRKISEVATPGLAYTMKLVGDYLYLADHRGGFHIINVADVAHPAIVGSAPTAGKAWAVEIAGNLAYVAADKAGLLVFDVSDPQQPKQIAAYDAGGAAEDVVLRDHYAYVASFDSGLHIFDIAQPMQAREVGHFATPGNARGIELVGDLAYVADWTSGIQILNVVDPVHPAAVGSYDTDGWAWGVRVRGRYAYVLDWWGGVTVLNVANPARPVQAGAYHARGVTRDVTVENGYAYVADGNNGLQVFDVKNPLNPIWMAGVDMAGDVQSVWLQEGIVYLAAGADGLAVVDARNPFEPRLRAQYPLRADLVRAGDGVVYAAERSRGVAVIDAASGREIARHDAALNDMWPAGKRLLLASDNGVDVLDMSAPAAPRVVKRLVQAASLVRVRDKLLALYDKAAGIVLYDAVTLKLLGRFNPGEGIVDMKISGKRLYAGGDENLLEIDVADARHPRLRAAYPLAGRAGGLSVFSGSAFMAGNDTLAEVRLLPEVKIRQERNGAISVETPKGMPPGSYDLLMLDAASGRRSFLRDALRVVVPPPKKPRFTMEDLERAMRKRGLDPHRHQ